jgi:peptidoglycan/LPS O-acetylase OafA/YrhL
MITELLNLPASSAHKGGDLSSSPGHGRVGYRPDIDGLRAVAVLAVIAFHFQTATGPFGGGFVGVDIFFVISGYLISSVIFAEVAASQFSIVAFYERRIRRIFPALFVMLAGVSILSYFYLLPNELMDYATSLVASTLSVSNFYFWRHSGYFDSPLTNPLLHTWSLAVEEQFYILFPLFLVLVRRYAPKRLHLTVAVLAALSLGLSAVGAYQYPTAAFYMPYTRAWELLLGTMLSLRLFPPIGSNLGRNAATVAGMASILFAIHWYSKTTPFPGLAALVPCLGAALIIASGEHGSSPVGRLLSLRPVVFIGLISYSLYLWHWPILVFKNFGAFYGMGQSHHQVVLVTFAFTMVFAVLSWRFVERPFRTGPLKLHRKPLFRLAAASGGVLLLMGSTALLSGGLAFRFPPRAVQIASYLGSHENYSYTRLGTCFITTSFSFENYNPSKCLTESSAKRNVLLIGDSHSAVLWDALRLSLPNTNFMQASASGCKPFIDLNGSGTCPKLMNFVYHDYLRDHHIDSLWLTGRWEDADIPKIGNLVAWAKTMRIPLVILGPAQEYDTPLPRLLASSIARNEPELSYEHRLAGLAVLDSKLENISANVWHVRYVSLMRVICSRTACLEYADVAHKVPLMSDSDHLSHAGSLLVVRDLIAQHQLP